jgi:hypothetical protein
MCKPCYPGLFSKPLTVKEEQNHAQCTTHEIPANFFADIPDPRRAQGRLHQLATVLAIVTAETLRGIRAYLAISDWAPK